MAAHRSMAPKGLSKAYMLEQACLRKNVRSQPFPETWEQTINLYLCFSNVHDWEAKNILSGNQRWHKNVVVWCGMKCLHDITMYLSLQDTSHFSFRISFIQYNSPSPLWSGSTCTIVNRADLIRLHCSLKQPGHKQRLCHIQGYFGMI